jgi:hypothetical protein
VDQAYTLVVDFFNHANMLYGTISEFCTQEEVRLSPSLPLPSCGWGG